MRLGGFRVHATPSHCVRSQWRFPRSKKRRIRRKWAKRQENWSVRPRTDILQIGDSLIMHPATMAALERELKESK